MNFLGHLVTTNGLKPDPAKCQANDEMPCPENKNGVQHLNSFVNYLAKFIPNKLSDVMHGSHQTANKERCTLELGITTAKLLGHDQEPGKRCPMPKIL